MAQKIEPTACDGRLSEANSDNQPALYGALASKSQALIGDVSAVSIPIVFIAPSVWKRLAAIPPGAENKDLARTRAIARWPAHAELFRRKCDVDRAESCLIALAGLQRRAGRG
jgi:hypothetical protein